MNSNVGTTRLSSCGCEIAWLYKDAHRYGINQYKQLIDGMSGGNNVICPEGPVLTTTDPEFKAKMEACPETPMPWGENYCHCYYHCTSQDTVAGHECCSP